MDDAADILVPPSRIIHAFRIRCLLHVLHLSVNAGMDNPFFVGPLGNGAWHKWPWQHLIGLLGIVWYNTSRTDVANTTWRQYRTMIVNSDLFPPSTSASSAAWASRVSAPAFFLRYNSSANSTATSFLYSSNLSDDCLCCSANVSADRRASTSSAAHRATAATRAHVTSLLRRCNAAWKSQRSAPDHPLIGEQSSRLSDELIANFLLFQSRSLVFFSCGLLPRSAIGHVI